MLDKFAVLLGSLLLGASSPQLSSQVPTGPMERLVAAPPARALEPWERERVYEYGRRMIVDQCQEQPNAMWCQRTPLATRPIQAIELVSLGITTKQKFHYVNDVVDSWRVHSARVMADQSWRGDCDDLTSTTLDMIARAGQPLTEMWFVLVNAQSPYLLDHVVGMVKDDQGNFWIVGDTAAQSAYPAALITYHVVGVASLDAPEKWVDPAGLAAFPAAQLVRR